MNFGDCEGCTLESGNLYTAVPADGSAPHLVRYCADCAAAYEGADMGASGCERQGTLTPIDVHDDTALIVSAIRDGEATQRDPMGLGEAVILASLARKRADRAREAQLDEQSRRARQIGARS